MSSEDAWKFHGAVVRLLQRYHLLGDEDAEQEANIAVWRAKLSYDAQRGASPLSWVYTCVSFTLIDYLRKNLVVARAASLNRLQDELGMDWAGAESVIESVLEQDQRETLWKLMYRLTEREYTVVYNSYFKHKPQRETAIELGISPSRVSQISTMAVKHLRMMAHEGDG